MTPRRKSNIYGYYMDDELVHVGTPSEIADKVECSKEYVYHLIKNSYSGKSVKLLRTVQNLYELYKPDGEVVFRGTGQECADYLYIAIESFWIVINSTRKGTRRGTHGGLLARLIGE